MAVDVRIQVQLQDLTAAGFQAMAANSRAAFNSMQGGIARMQGASGRITATGQDLAQTGLMIAAPIVGVGVAAAREAIAVESAMADVNKVLGRSESQMAGVEQGIINLSTRAKDALPLPVVGLADIAAAGGTLGISAKEILGFTEVTAKMGTAFDISAEKAGNAVANMRNVYSLDTKGGVAEITELGDAVNTLSNNMAARAGDIVEAMTRIGGTTRNFGLAKEQSAALAASMIALGNAPELAATAINNILPALQGATGQTKRFKEGLAMAGISAEGMSSMVRRDGVGAINKLLVSLNKLEPQSRTLAIQKMFGAGIDARVLATLSNDAGQFARALGLVSDRGKMAGSMQREFEIRAATTANSLQIMKNNLTAMSITLGKILLPTVNSLVRIINPILSGIAAFAEANPGLTRLIVTGLAVTAAFGGLLVIAGSLVFFAGQAIGAIAGIAGAIGFVATAATGGTVAVGGLVASTGVGAAAVAGGAGVAFSALAAVALPLGVLALGAFLLIRNWRKIPAFFSGLWSAIANSSKALWAGLILGWQAVTSEIAKSRNVVVFDTEGATGQANQFRQGLAMAGISAEQMSTMVQKDGVGAIDRLIDSLDDLDQTSRRLAIKKIFFSGNDTQAASLLGNSAGNLSTAFKSVGDQGKVAGSIQQKFAVSASTAAIATAKLKSNLASISLILSKGIIPSINQLIAMIDPAAAKLSAFAEANPEVTRLAIGALAVVGAFGSLFVIADKVSSRVARMFAPVEPAKAAIDKATASASRGAVSAAKFAYQGAEAFVSIGLISTALAAVAGATLPISAIIGLAVGAWLVVKNWRQIPAFFSKVWARVSTSGKAAWSGLVAGSRAAVGAIAPKFQKLVNNISTFFSQSWLNVATGSKAAWAWVAASGSKAWSAVAAGGGKAWAWIATTSNKAWVGVTNSGKAAWTWIAASGGKAWTWIATSSSNTWAWIATTSNKAWSAVAASGGKAWAWISASSNKAWSAITTPIANLGSQFFNAGANLIGQLIQGIKSGIGAIVATIANITARIRAFLPFSPAKQGALADLDKVSILGTVTANVRQQAAPLASAVGGAMQGARTAIAPISAVGGAMQGGGSPIAPNTTTTADSGGLIGGAPKLTPPTSGGGITINYNPSITLPGSGTPTEADRATFREELERHSDQIARIVANLDRNRARIAY